MSYSSPETTSGGMNFKVPAFESPSLCFHKCAEMPKSMIFTWWISLFPIIIFAGFMSQCTIYPWWQYKRASSIYLTMILNSFSETPKLSFTYLFRSEPGIYSIKNIVFPLVRNLECNFTMLSWLRFCSEVASLDYLWTSLSWFWCTSVLRA